MSNLRSLFPHGSNAFFNANSKTHCQLSATEPKPRLDKLGRRLRSDCWTTAEDEILRKAYDSTRKNFKLKAVMEQLPNRSRAAVACRVNELGLRLRRTPFTGWPSKAKYPPGVGKLKQIEALKLRHATTVHPMLGKTHSEETRAKISKANQGRKIPQEQIDKMMRTRVERGIYAPNFVRGTWKAGWREIGGKRIYARSRWEANYARYLEFLKVWGQIKDWEHEAATFWFNKIKRGCRSYLPDFEVLTNDDSLEYHEVKGWMDDRSKTKIKRMAKYYPEITLIIRDATWFKANNSKLKLCIPEWENKPKLTILTKNE